MSEDYPYVTKRERLEIAEILSRRANEIAVFSSEYTRDGKYFGSVELALSREISRLRDLSDKVDPVEPDEE